jgi:hypothetical protein
MNSIKWYFGSLLRNTHYLMFAHICFLSALASKASFIEQDVLKLLLSISMCLNVNWLLLMPAQNWQGKQNYEVYPKIIVIIFFLLSISVILLSLRSLIVIQLSH